MKSKERLIAALNHQEVDRVPLDLGGWVSTINVKAYTRLPKKLGIQREGRVFDWLRQNVSPEEDVLERLGVDTRYVHLGEPHAWHFEPKKPIRGSMSPTSGAAASSCPNRPCTTILHTAR